MILSQTQTALLQNLDVQTPPIWGYGKRCVRYKCTHLSKRKNSHSHSRSWLHNNWANSLCLLQHIFTFTRQLHLLSTKVLKLKNCQLQDRKSWKVLFFKFQPRHFFSYKYIMCEVNRKVLFIPCMWLHSLLGLSGQAAGQVFLVVLSFLPLQSKNNY